MKIIINHSSMQPIYEQILGQIKDMILHEELKEGDPLPSVRAMSKELRISSLTVKKAYDALEQEGLVITVHGKGSYVANPSPGQLLEEKIRDLESEFSETVRKARVLGMNDEEIQKLFTLVLEEL